MKKETTYFNFKGKKLKIEAYKVPWWYEGIGLMFTKKNSAKALAFNFKKSTNMGIFSFFIPFNFLAIWFDNEGEIIEQRIVKPREINIKTKRKFVKLIEIPITKKYAKIIYSLVGEKV